ncbi:VWA domain-containing protein [Actinomycetaceae bacterium L2_0104]
MGWLVPAAVGLALAIGWYAWRRWRQSRPVIRVAHTARVREARRFRSRLSRYRGATLALTFALAAVVLSAATIAGRPSDRLDVNDKMATRDIVLCLDVSGSVIDFDSQVLDTFSDLVKGFQGERVSLIIFNSSARTVFPLSDDYTMIGEQLREASEALEVSGVGINVWPKNVDEFRRLTTGTEADILNGSSLVGDGLVSCTQAFDLEDDERSRTLILATDNEILGDQLFTLPEAASLVEERDIKLYGLFIDSVLAYEPDEEGMRQAVEDAEGTFFYASDAEAAKTIVEDVQQQDAKELGATPRLVIFDRPGLWPVVSLAGVGIIVIVGWRFRL